MVDRMRMQALKLLGREENDPLHPSHLNVQVFPTSDSWASTSRTHGTLWRSFESVSLVGQILLLSSFHQSTWTSHSGCLFDRQSVCHSDRYCSFHFMAGAARSVPVMMTGCWSIRQQLLGVICCCCHCLNYWDIFLINIIENYYEIWSEKANNMRILALNQVKSYTYELYGRVVFYYSHLF